MKKILKLFSALLIFGTVFQAEAQAPDLARVEYTYFPQSKSDNSFNRFKAFLKFPIELNKDGAYLIPGIQYTNVNFSYQDTAPFPTGDLEHFQSYALSLGYTYKMNEDWRFGFEGEIDATSNFETKTLMSEDLEYTGSVYFIKSKKEEQSVQSWRLILGLRYSTATSIKFPLPIVNYYKRFDPKWSYTLGVPKMNLRYFLNDKSGIQAFVTIDGFYANIQSKFNPSGTGIVNDDSAQNISMTTFLSGLGYELNFTKYISFYIYGGHSFSNNIRLRDRNKDKVYTINNSNSLYGRTGLKFSIL